MKLQRYSIILIIIIFTLVGCTYSDVEESSDGIVSYSLSTSLGGKDNSGDITVL
jgi:hypothetical protein